MNYKHLLMALFLLMLSHSSNAALYLVNTADDFPDNDLMDGVCDTGLSAQVETCSLRAAIMEANASQNVEDTIVLPNNIGNYRLSRVDEDDDAFKGDLDITDDVAVINGTLAGATIDADFIDRAFHVHTNARLTLEGINIVNGLANTPNTYQGGAVFVDGGELVAERVTFNNNVANQGGAIYGVDAFVSLDQAYFHHNATSEEPNLSRGSAFYIEGSEVLIGNTTVAHNINPSSNPQVASIAPESSAIFAVGNTSDVLIYNSTVAQNYNGISFSSGNQLNIIQTTIANNAAYGMRVISAENLLIERSLYAQNDTNCLIGAISMNTTLEYNGSTDSSCNFTGVTHIENMSDSLHGALNHWGGYAPTLMLYKNSEAIDAVTGCDTDFLVDQRGADRPVDGNDDNLAFCDMGAIEFNPQTDDDIIFRNGFD